MCLLPTLSTAMINITPIQVETGFISLGESTVELVSEFKMVLHIISPKEILELTNIIQNNTKILVKKDKHRLDTEIETIKIKIRSITPNSLARQKRGLINAIGKTQKWLTGLMDDDDREIIMNHLLNNQENQNNIFNNINKQVKINNDLQNSINTLKEVILDDREKITKTLNNIETYNTMLRTDIMYHDQLLKLKFLHDKVDTILDTIASAKYNLFHPSILTNEEFILYNIDFYKIKLIRMGVMTYDTNIIIAIKIPTNIITTTVFLITPLTNQKNKRIDMSPERVIKIENKTYTYEEQKTINELKLSSNCIIKRNCKMIEDVEFKTKLINEGTLLISNAQDNEIQYNCNNTTKSEILRGNFLIEFTNCTVLIDETYYKNSQEIYIQSFANEEEEENSFNFTEKLTFKEIVLKEIENTKTIKRIKIQTIVSNSFGIVSITLVLLFIGIYSYNKCKRGIQENPSSKGGGVMQPIKVAQTNNIIVQKAKAGQTNKLMHGNADNDEISIIMQRYLNRDQISKA